MVPNDCYFWTRYLVDRLRQTKTDQLLKRPTDSGLVDALGLLTDPSSVDFEANLRVGEASGKVDSLLAN